MDSSDPHSQEFTQKIKSFAKENNWTIAELSEVHAIFKFKLHSTRVQTCYLLCCDDYVEFFVPSLLNVAEEELPHLLSSFLLKRNSQCFGGFWAIREIDCRKVYSFLQSLPLAALDGAYFAQLVNQMVQEVESFEELMAKSTSLEYSSLS